eukprot:gene5093-210_t
MFTFPQENISRRGCYYNSWTKIVGVLKGKDSNGRNVSLLTTCPHIVQLALPEEERKCFNSLKELCEQESRPKFVEIKLEKETESVQNGDRLKVLLVERGSKGPLFMHFRNEKGKHVRLPVEIEATFTACPPDGKEYFISEIANINKAPLALFIQFVQTPDHGNDMFHSLGIIEITEQTTVDMLFMTLRDGGNFYCCVCVTPEDLTGFVPRGYKEDEYDNFRKTIKEFVDLEKIETVHGNSNPQESDYFFLLLFDKVFGKRKLKDKGKRVQSLALDVDEDKEKKRSSFLAIFKDEKSKENSDNEKKEKKEKKKNKKEKGKEAVVDKKEEQESEVKGSATADNENSSCKDETSIASENDAESTEMKIKVDSTAADTRLKEENEAPDLPVEMSPKLKKKAKEEKKKWRFDFKSKISGNDKKEKKNKKENSLDRNLKQQTSSDKSKSEPCSPNEEFGDDDYELAAELETIAAQNLPADENHKGKEKSTTLISRTWKKMKKRRRAFSASNMASSADKSADKTGDKGDVPPPPMAPDYSDDIYEQIPGEFMSQDIYEEAYRAYGAYEQPVAIVSTTDTVDSGFDELDQKALDTLRQSSAPPPLPGNHPVMQSASRPRRGSSVKSNKGTRISVDSEGFRRFYESMRASEAVIRSWGPDEIEKALIDLQLGHHFDKFNESQIDGSLLIDLDEAVLRDLGLSLFEARKLRKFVFGWRPDSMRDSVYQQKYSKSSKNPFEWSTEMVADMIKSELGIPELAKFCLENQVNGDLLKDIVVDEEVLNFLLTGKAMRLNAVKLKNYVLDGWRPPKKKETRAGIPECEIPSGSDSTYQPLTPTSVQGNEASDEYEEPLLLSPRSQNDNPRTGKAAKDDVTNKREAVSPARWKGEEKSTQEQGKAIGTPTAGINSLMQKYEKKSSSVDAPRPFKKVSSPRSPSFGDNQSNGSNLSFVANMKMKFNDK